MLVASVLAHSWPAVPSIDFSDLALLTFRLNAVKKFVFHGVVKLKKQNILMQNFTITQKTWLYIQGLIAPENIVWVLNPLNACVALIETSQLICFANQLTSFYMRATLKI